MSRSLDRLVKAHLPFGETVAALCLIEQLRHLVDLQTNDLFIVLFGHLDPVRDVLFEQLFTVKVLEHTLDCRGFARFGPLIIDVLLAVHFK